jgi:hypothetical protein
VAKLADETIAGVALNAGFTGNALPVAVAVALAESGGNPRAHNALPPDDSYGLWQINMIGAMGPERRKRFGLKANDDLYDPSTNAKVAHAFWTSRGGFADWSTYNHGSYLAFLPRANAAVKKNGGAKVASGSAGDPSKTVPGNRPDTPLPDPIENAIYDMRDTLTGVSAFIKTLTDPKTWIRVGMFVGGVILIIVGVLFLIGQSKAARAVASAVPVGRAVKAVT